MYKLFEMTRNDILRGVSPEPWKLPMSERAKGYQYRLREINVSQKERELIVVFDTQKVGHTKQRVIISLEDFWTLFDANEESEKKENIQSLINYAIMEGNLKVFCTCPAWIYTGSKYIGTKLDYAFGPQEHRFPSVRNPKLMGTVCKHIYVILKALPFHKNTITSFVKKELNNG